MTVRNLILLDLVAIAMVLVLTPLACVPSIESDLAARCRSELASEDIRSSIVEVNGRDVVLEGRLPSVEVVDRAEDVVASVWGVRRVVNRLIGQPVSPEARAEGIRQPFCEVILTPSRLFVLGLLPDEVTRSELMTSLATLNLERELENRLEVMNGVGRMSEAASVPVITRILAETLDQASLRVEGDTVTLKGSAPDEPTRQTVNRLVAAALPGLRVRDLIVVDPASPSSGAFGESLDALFMSGGIDFEPGTEVLTASSLRRLDELVRLLERYPAARIAIAVPVEPTGDTELDLELRELRAEAVTDYLRLRSVADGRYRVPHTEETPEPGEIAGGAIGRYEAYVVEDR